jgi:hypothetical protein
LPEAEALVALADGEQSTQSERVLADVARSGMHADLLRFTRALAPESARLGVALEQAFEADAPRHRRDRVASGRRAAPRRAWVRVAFGMAASLVVAFGVWTAQRHRQPAPTATAASVAPAPDRIFAALDEGRHQRADRIFNGAFASDEIFRARFNGG